MQPFSNNHLNRFLLVPLSGHDRITELRYGGSERMGRKTCPSLDNLHISRDQLRLEVKLDRTGSTYVCMHNSGKNSTRIVSVRRGKHARVLSMSHIRIVPEDVIEVLYDQQGRYAFKLVECTPAGGPLVRPTPMVTSYNDFHPFYMPTQWLSDPTEVKCRNNSQADFLARTEYFVLAVDTLLCAAATATVKPSLSEFVRAIAKYLTTHTLRTDQGQKDMLYIAFRASEGQVLLQRAHSSFARDSAMVSLARAVLMLVDTGGQEIGIEDAPWPLDEEGAPKTAAPAKPSRSAGAGGAAAIASPPGVPPESAHDVAQGEEEASAGARGRPSVQAGAGAGRPDADAMEDGWLPAEASRKRGGRRVRAPEGGIASHAGSASDSPAPDQDGEEEEGGAAGMEVEDAQDAPRIRRGGGQHEDAVEEWDEADAEEDARAAALLAGEMEDDTQRAPPVPTSPTALAMPRSMSMKPALLDLEEESEGTRGEGKASRGPNGGRQSRSRLRYEDAAPGADPAVPLPPMRAGMKRAAPYDGPRAGETPPRLREAELPSSKSLVAAGMGAGASAGEGYASSSPRLAFHDLPQNTLAMVLSFLPLPQQVAAGGVCKEWKEELAKPGALAHCDYGSVFPGPIPPDPVILDRISRSVRGRDLYFANCTWLTTGALLHIMGVPLGAHPVAHTPAVRGATTSSSEGARKALAEGMAGQIVAEQSKRAKRSGGLRMGGRGPSSDDSAGEEEDSDDELSVGDLDDELLPQDTSQLAPGTHTYLRYFLGEYHEQDLLQMGCSPGDGDGGVAARTGPSKQAGAGAGAAGAGAGDTMEDAAPPAKAADAALTSSLPWWPSISSGVSTALAGHAPSWLPLSDLCLSVVGAEVLRLRMGMQHEDLQRTSIPGSPTRIHLQPDIAGPAYAEMAIAMLALRHRAAQLRGPQEEEEHEAHEEDDSDSDEPYDPDVRAARAEAKAAAEAAAAARRVAKEARLEERLSTTLPRGVDKVGHTMWRGYPVLDKTAPPVLLSGTNFINTACMVGATSVFAPLSDLRRAAAMEYASLLQLSLDKEFGPTEGRKRMKTVVGRNAPGDPSVPCTDREVHALVLNQFANIHGMAVAYTVATADLFEFEVNLADSKIREAAALSKSAALVASGAAFRTPVRGAPCVPISPPVRRGHAHHDPVTTYDRDRESVDSVTSTLLSGTPPGEGAGEAGLGASKLGGADAEAGLLPHLRGSLFSWDIPAPVHHEGVHNRLPGGQCCPPPAEDMSEETRDALGPCLQRNNILGPPLPMTYTTAVTGLDLACCQRLSPSNFALLLSYCPHLTMLRLTGCYQMAPHVLAQAFSRVPKLRMLDLEYMQTVNDLVLASLGRHCHALTRLNLGGCGAITDAGMGASGLLGGPGCTKLRFLNLRGCRNLTDASLVSLVTLCPGIRELIVTGIPQLTPAGLVHFLALMRQYGGRLARFKAELWSERGPEDAERPVSSQEHVEVPPDTAGNKRQYRLMGSVVGSVRYLLSILPADDPQQTALRALYPEALVEPPLAAGAALHGAGAGQDSQPGEPGTPSGLASLDGALDGPHGGGVMGLEFEGVHGRGEAGLPSSTEDGEGAAWHGHVPQQPANPVPVHGAGLPGWPAPPPEATDAGAWWQRPAPAAGPGAPWPGTAAVTGFQPGVGANLSLGPQQPGAAGEANPGAGWPFQR